MRKVNLDIDEMERSMHVGDGLYIQAILDLTNVIENDKIIMDYNTKAELVWFLSEAIVIESLKKENFLLENTTLMGLILINSEKEDLYDLLREVESAYIGGVLKRKDEYVQDKNIVEDSIKNFITMINFVFSILFSHKGGFEKRNFKGIIFKSIKNIYHLSEKEGRVISFNLEDFSRGIVDHLYDNKDEPVVYL